jgi:nucleotide-binding universal stress UspA family protein
MVEIEKILFPLDLTEDSSKILPYVLSLSETYNGSLYLLHVVEYGRYFGFDCADDIPLDDLEERRQKALEEAQKMLDRLCAEHLQGCAHFDKRVAFGNPTMEILKMVESEGIDLIVMGTHGRGQIGQCVLGSVADNVIKSSPVPVVVINPDRVKQRKTLDVRPQAA